MYTGCQLLLCEIGLGELTRAEIREEIIEFVGEGAWLYVCYNNTINDLIKTCSSVHELAEKIQDLAAAGPQRDAQ